MRTYEEGGDGGDDCTDYADEDPHPDYPCRHDGRCQYAIDSGVEGLGHCPRGKCVMPEGYIAWHERAEVHSTMPGCGRRKAAELMGMSIVV